MSRLEPRAGAEPYTRQGPITDPGQWAHLYDGLPAEFSTLSRIVQGLLLHVHWADRYGVQLGPERKEEVQLRHVQRMLRRIVALDDRPLIEARAAGARLVGTCRDYTVLLCSMLRHQGIPARARCGFGAYFRPGTLEDHWVVEWWDAARGRWRLGDGQLDAFQREVLGIAFDPLDVPRDQFVVAGQAWQGCRGGRLAAEDCGIFDLRGLWFVRANVVRDLAAVNRVELLPWDVWGLAEVADAELTGADLALLDRVADLTAGPASLDELRVLYEGDARLRVPATVRSFTDTGVQTVHLDPGGHLPG